MAGWALKKRVPFKDIPGAHLPDIALVMLVTRQLNRWLGTSYNLDEVADMLEIDSLFYDIFGALVSSLVEPEKTTG